MFVEDSTLERAVLGVFRQVQNPGDEFVPYRALQAQWSSTGLRGEDLRDAVRVVLERRLLEIEDSQEGMAFRLSKSGRRRCQKLGIAATQLNRDLRDVMKLLRARHRPAPGSVDAQQRRANDAA